MENDWSRQELLSAARNYIESHMRDGFVSEKPLNVQPAPKVAAPIVPKPATAPIPKPFTASMPTSITGSLEEIRATLGNCTRCALSKDRKNIVYGVGNPKADLVIVGEAPGRDEDLQGEPFVGAAGQLLTDILKAIGLERSDVYICNVIKCRPPNNRPPETDEIDQCSPFVQAQIDAISPKLICSLGKFATQTLLKTDQSITRLRGRFQDYKGIPLMPTFHPAYLLRNPDAKKDVWEDMKKIHAEYITRTGKDIKRKGK